MATLLLLAVMVHFASLPSHFARAKTFLQIWFLRRTIDAVCTQSRCSTSYDQYWDVDDFYEANGIVPNSGFSAYLFYCLVAAAVTGIPALNLPGLHMEIVARADASPLTCFLMSWLVLVIINRTLALLRFVHSTSVASATLDSSLLWLLSVLVSLTTASPASFLVVLSTFAVTGLVFVGSLFGVLSLPPIKRRVLFGISNRSVPPHQTAPSPISDQL